MANLKGNQQNSTGTQQFTESVDRAARITEAMFAKDNESPTLFQAVVGTQETGLHPVSGLVEQDYPGLLDRGIVSRKLFTIEHQSPIPADLKDLASKMEGASCRMGLFPQICRAWMSIDSDMYFWDYRDGTALSFYDGITDPIISVQLVAAKPNIFQTDLKYVLCVTSATQIFLIGFVIRSGEEHVPADGNDESIMEMVNKPLYVISSDGLLFPAITATSQGRIFLGGMDGHIYEVFYQAERSWIWDSCWKKNLTKSMVSKYLPSFLYISSTDPIRDMSVDTERNILYTLAKSGQIEAFDLGVDGSGFNSVGSLSIEVIVNSVIMASKKSLEPSLVKQILSISPIYDGELNLVAVCDTGARLYFTCLPTPSRGWNPSIRPSTLKLAHVRLPPGHSPMSTVTRPTGISVAHYSNGLLTLSSNANRDSSILWLITPFMYPTRSYPELCAVHNIPGMAIEIKDVPVVNISPVLLELPEVRTQHLLYHREIVILTNQATLVIRASKPYELLRDLLADRLVPENVRGHFEMLPYRIQPLANCVLLAIYPFLHTDTTVQEFATKLLYLFGGGQDMITNDPIPPNPTDARYEVHTPQFDAFSAETRRSPVRGSQRHSPYTTLRQTNSPSSLYAASAGRPTLPTSPIPTGISTPITSNYRQRPTSGQIVSPVPLAISTPIPPNYRQAPNSGLDFSPVPIGVSSPMSSNYRRGSSLGQNFNPVAQTSQQHVEFWPYSVKHDAIYTTVARILGSYWNNKLLRTGTSVGNPDRHVVMPNISGDEVCHSLHFLQSLHTFLLNNPTLYMSNFKGDIGSLQLDTTPEGRRHYYCELEKMSMAALKNLLSHSLEVLGMWKILCDHQLHIILKGVDDQLLNTTLRDLIVSGQKTINVIINSLISKYLGDNAAVDSITVRLREVCPTLFRNEDAISSKVAEILHKAKQTTNVLDRGAMLQDSLVLCEEIFDQSGGINILSFCKDFAQLEFPLGAIKLCESAAKAADPKNLAPNTFKTSPISKDLSSVEAYNARCEIYKIMVDILEGYFKMANPSGTPVLTGKEDGILPSEKARFHTDETIQGILESEDEVFHTVLYNWLLEKNMYEQILEIKHPFLEAFLQRAATSTSSGKWSRTGISANEIRILDLLWRHYQLNDNHLGAAQILAKLAECVAPSLTFNDRLDYLARANICIKGAGRYVNAMGDDRELSSVDAKLEVAQLQKSIFEILKARLENLKQVALDSTNDASNANATKLLQEAIQRLNLQLFNIDALFTDFAVPFKLYETKLEIFRVANQTNVNLIEGFYADIIEAEIEAGCQEPILSQLELIRKKIISLGKKYCSVPPYFPAEYLVEHLESMKPTNEDIDELWVPEIMSEVGLQFGELIRIYERFWGSIIRRTNPTLSLDVRVARVIMKMISSMVSRRSDIGLHWQEVSELSERCKGLLANLIVEYGSKFDPEGIELCDQLKIVKDKLENASL